MDFLPIIDRPVKVQFNERDIQYIENNAFYNPIPKKGALLSMDPTPIDTTCGFKIQSIDGAFTIDYTFETLVDKFRQDLSMVFMKIFPIFEIHVKSALEIDQAQHGGAKRHED